MLLSVDCQPTLQAISRCESTLPNLNSGLKVTFYDENLGELLKKYFEIHFSTNDFQQAYFLTLIRAENLLCPLTLAAHPEEICDRDGDPFCHLSLQGRRSNDPRV